MPEERRQKEKTPVAKRLTSGCNKRSLRSGLRTLGKPTEERHEQGLRAACEWSKGGAKEA
jgi:hypothetical protein